MKKECERFSLIVGVRSQKFLTTILIILGIFFFNINLINAETNASVCATLSSANTYYTLNQSVTSVATCFTVSAANITLDCKGFNITYSTGGTASNYGIITTQFNTTIKNCKVIDGNWTSSVISRYGIYTQTQGNNTIYNNTVNTSSAIAIYILTGQWNNLTGNIGITNSTTTNYGGIRLDSGNSTLTNNTGISTSSTPGIVLTSAASSNCTLINNNGTSVSGYGIYLVSGSNNTLTSNNGTGSSGFGIYLTLDSNNTLTNNNGTSNSSYGIYLYSTSNNTLTGNNGISNTSYGIYLNNVSNNTLNSNAGNSSLDYGIYLNNVSSNTFINFNWPDYSYVSLNSSLKNSLIASNLNSFCVPSVNSSSANFSYKKSDETTWQTLTATRTRDIYTLGDSITTLHDSRIGNWQKSLDSYMGSNSFYHNFGTGSTFCSYSYDRYVQNVTNSSNATVIVFCGVNDATHSVALENTTSYYELMYNLSVARNQSIVFVNVGTCGSAEDAINSWLLSFTQEKGVPLVDFHSFFNDFSSGCATNLTITADGIHPNNYGYKLLGKLIWEQGFNSNTTFTLNKSLIHFDQGKTYDIKCTSNDDGNIFQMSYTLPSTFVSGGGIIDNASTLNTTLTNVTAKINETSYNSSSVYYDSTLINITSDTSTLEFNYNFSKYDFNFTSVSIDNETVGDKKFLSVWGIAEDGVVGTKSMKIYNANTAYNSVCVKDQENVTSISAACTDTNETKVLCDSNSHNGYTCTFSGTTLTIAGLKHSGVMQMYQDVSVAAAEDNSGSGPGSFNPSNQTLENGYNANVAKDDKINFKFNNETKTILIEKVSADNVEFSIDSKDYSVTVNQTLKIDLNSDGYYDIQIFLKSVYSGRASLELKLINEKIPAEEQASSQEQNKTENTPEKKSNYKWIFIAAGVLILAFVIKLFFNKKYEKKFGKK